MENLLDKTTQLWVKVTGKRIKPEKYQWLLGPIGDPKVIGDSFISALAKEEDLTISADQPNYGLVESVEDMGITSSDKKTLRPEIVEFYEKTSNYDFEFWSEWCGFFRPFGELLSILFSKRLQQLNLPLSPIDSSKGLLSSIIKLKKGEATKWTIWFRTLKATNHVIYSGVYTVCKPDGYSTPLLKVIFPLPNGNASVIMTKQILKDGSLLLSSDGKRFGENGFYFTLTDRKGNFWARHVKAMHEWIRIYVDDENVLRADHNLYFHGFRFLNLHYKMIKKQNLSNASN